MMSKLKRRLAAHKTTDIAFLVLVTLLATCGWLNLDFPRGHDAVADMLLAQFGIESVFNHGMCSGWANQWYMGLPLFQVHPPLVHAVITALSFPFGWILGTKLLYLSIYVLSGIFAYFYVHEITKSRMASFVAGLAYVFLPYHVLDMGFEGHHGAFGMPYMLTPLILLCFERLVRNPGTALVLITTLLLTALTLSYPQVFPFLIGPFLFLYVLFRAAPASRGAQSARKPLMACLLPFCGTLALTAFWWLPLIPDIQNFQQTEFPLEAAKQFSATFPQAISLRIETCCAPTSAYGASGSILVEMLRILPLGLVLVGVILNFRNRLVWFFSASVVVTWLLAMGPYSPIDIFSFAHNHIPFFSGIRTPVRFLLFTSLAYAVLIGLCAKTIGERLERIRFTRPSFLNLSSLALLIIGLVVVGNTWQENRGAFRTFTLSSDRENAYAWLDLRQDGLHRMTSLPFETWAYDPEAGNMIDPVYWTYLHGQETVGGGVPAMAVKYTGNTLESLNSSLEGGVFDMSAWLSIFNVKYLLVDKTAPDSSRIIIGEDFERVWSSETIDIYENHSMLPRAFSFTEKDERVVDLYTGDSINLAYGEGTQEALLTLSDEHLLYHEFAVKSSYHFSAPNDYLCLEAGVEQVTFGEDDAIRLAFYSQRDLPDVHLSLGLYEADDSRYDIVLNAVDGIKAGWNEVSFPLSLLVLRYSVDENLKLDPAQIDRLYIGVGKQWGSTQARQFDLFFDKLSVVAQEINANLEYTRVKPGEYLVHIDSDSPSYLVLSQSYHPNWVARWEGTEVKAEMIYGCLNGFHMGPGEYDVALVFTTSPLRKAASIVSAISLLALVGVASFLAIRARRSKKATTLGALRPGNSDTL